MRRRADWMDAAAHHACTIVVPAPHNAFEGNVVEQAAQAQPALKEIGPQRPQGGVKSPAPAFGRRASDDVSPESVLAGLKPRMVLFSAILLVLVGLVTWRVAFDAQARIIEYQAVNLAEVVARQAASTRAVYTENVVEKLRDDGFGAHEDYAGRRGFVALPAQFLKMLGQSATADSAGLYRYRALSKWNLAQEQGLSDSFQRWAWSELEAQDRPDPRAPIAWQAKWRIETLDGVRTLRYMRADPALGPACVSCHNMHEQRPEIMARRSQSGVATGKQWRQHQLLGAMEVSIPLDKVETFASGETSRTMGIVVGVVVAGLLIIGFFAFTDVTRARSMARQLAWHARHDSLTGMINRTELEWRLEKLLQRAHENGSVHALLFMDLDQFKVINDTSGHAVGDELLRQIGAVLKDQIRSSDTLARLGGDEFGVLIEHCPPESAREIADRLRQTVQDSRFVWDGRTYEIGASIGLVMVDRHSRSAAALMSAADVACYAAKDAGRNRVHVYTQGDSEIGQRQAELEWASRIARALKENWFQLVIQDGISLRPDVAYRRYSEVLLRMNDEHGKPVPIQTVIGAAERYGLMPTIDRWVLNEVCALLARGKLKLEEGRVIAINISGSSVSDEGFLEYAAGKMRMCGANAARICFELTETAAVRNFARAKEFIGTLREFGCHFALDDFGSGLSSFGYLRNLPVNFLKVDGNFVRNIEHDAIDRNLVQAITQIGHVMRIPIVAEWVENDAVLEIVKGFGVDYAQGYGVNRPRPIE
jgi:diguanylate cyclase (GGDEF)-like protein